MTATDPAAGTLRLPPAIHVGYGTRAQVPALLARHGARVLVVADPFLPGTPHFEELIAGLTAAGLTSTVTSDIQPELPVASLDAAAETARRFGPDVVLAIGGGSALDAAKLVTLLLAHGGRLADYYGENAVPGPVLPLIAMPTTAGTGSEVTPVAVVSDPDRELKVGISSPYLVPLAAVVDPELTLGAPASVTAFSGIDALVHAAESYTARPLPLDWSGVLPVFTGRNAFSDVLALQAARELGTWLPVVVTEPGHRHGRERVALGSLLAGMSFGPTGTHLSHALQYPIGALTKTPHGLGTGLMLPYVLEACLDEPAAAERIADLGAALGATGSADDRARGAITRLVDINRTIGVPASLAQIGVGTSDLPRIAELAMGARRLVDIAPIETTPERLLDILQRAHAGLLTEGTTS